MKQHPIHSGQRGVALIAVLWLVAAMGIMVTGVVRSVKSELGTIGAQRQALIANVRADAAILHALQNLHEQARQPGPAIEHINVGFDGTAFRVAVTPLNGRIDLNSAPPALLGLLYQHAGGTDARTAQALAQATVSLRQTPAHDGSTQGIDAPEDLLQVPGMTYGLYAKLVGLVTAEIKQGSGRINPLAAPAGVIQVLSGGDTTQALAFVTRRDTDPGGVDTTFLQQEHIEMASSRSLRLHVQMEMPDGKVAQRAWHVLWAHDPRSGLPWRVLDIESAMLPRAEPGT